MRFLCKISSILFAITFVGCSASKQAVGQVVESGDKQVIDTASMAPKNELWITTYGFGNTKGSSLQNAIQNGFRALLQDGFPGNFFPDPVLGKNGKTIIETNKAYFDRFFNSDMHLFVLDREIHYFNYVSATEPSSKIAILVKVEALRNQLIKDKILSPPPADK